MNGNHIIPNNTYNAMRGDKMKRSVIDVARDLEKELKPGERIKTQGTWMYLTIIDYSKENLKKIQNHLRMEYNLIAEAIAIGHHEDGTTISFRCSWEN